MTFLKENNYVSTKNFSVQANERRDEGKSQVYSTESLNLPKYSFSHWLRRFLQKRIIVAMI